MKELKHFKRISDYHKFANLPAPEHPLISLVDYTQISYPADLANIKWVQYYYTIGLKRNIPYKFHYGQQAYDFDEGLMTFIAPSQVMSLVDNPNIGHKPSGWLLLVHPDFLWNTHLAGSIKNYGFFAYAINEALFLSEKEESVIVTILRNIKNEYQSTIDQFSQKIIIAQLEVMLNYAERFYERQFITREKANHQVLARLEAVLTNYFNQENLIEKGLPSVNWVAENLNLSPNYLSNMLKSLTGQSTQQHIHDKLIEKAKSQISTSQLSISEIAYNLGFERPSSFSKLFKSKTAMSPLAFRKSFK